MKDGIHPKYYPEARVICACGNTWVTGSTQEEIRTDVCSKCHPFFTGQMLRIVDAGGQVERFNKRVEIARGLGQEAKERAKARERRRRERMLLEVVDEESVEPIEGLADEGEAEE
ncbi:MAG TPA: 50S ribosomal protein L31 [Chloroflexi bacterium]|jgi:large subunit ribosomal protein L31|nr:50S ribosomal protein L31 [Chloroflexota bacterium]